MMSPLLELKSLECRYRDQTVVRDLSLHVNQGDLLCLLGPSGCGKTTVLRAIAGFEPLVSGEILLKGVSVSRPGLTIPPEKRHIGMVFQDYALFPHLTVGENICFGLRDMSQHDKRETSRRMLKTVGLEDLGERFVHELSGGQQQRVALARAIAPKPNLVLLDEPFSNLDVDMREHLSQEVRRILKEQGTTGILVTHDQLEAFAVGDHIGVMHGGKILQRDTAYNLYHSPNSPFVADFIGQGVFLKGTLLAPDTVETELGIIKGDRAYDWPRGTAVKLLLRPDDIVQDNEGSLLAKVCHKAFKGAEILYTLHLPTGSKVLSLFASHHNHDIGDRVRIRLAQDHMIIFEDK